MHWVCAFAVLLNESPAGYFWSSRGIEQEDPSFLFLFLSLFFFLIGKH